MKWCHLDALIALGTNGITKLCIKIAGADMVYKYWDKKKKIPILNDLEFTQNPPLLAIAHTCVLIMYIMINDDEMMKGKKNNFAYFWAIIIWQNDNKIGNIFHYDIKSISLNPFQNFFG